MQRTRAITVIERRRRRGIVKSRVCELSAFDSSSAPSRERDSPAGFRLAVREIPREISLIPDFHATGSIPPLPPLLLDETVSFYGWRASAIIREFYGTI